MWLSMATYQICVSSLYRIGNTLDIKKNTVKSSGKGPNLLAQKFKMNKTEKNYIKQCVRSLEEGNITDNEDEQVAEYFVSNKKAKHRYLNTTT